MGRIRRFAPDDIADIDRHGERSACVPEAEREIERHCRRTSRMLAWLGLPQTRTWAASRFVVTFPIFVLWAAASGVSLALRRIRGAQPPPRNHEPLRVVYLSHQTGLTGAPRSLADILQNLAGTHVTPIVVLPDTGILHERVRGMGLAPFVLPVSELTLQTARLRLPDHACRAIICANTIAKLVDALDAHLVHTNVSTCPDGALAAWATRRPHVWHFREPVVRPRRFRQLTRIVNRLADAVPAVSHHAARAFVEHGGRRDLVRVLHNFVTVPPPSEERSLDALRGRIGLPREAIAVGCVGHLSAAKGQAILVEAFSGIAPDRPNLFLVLVGEAAPDDRLQLLAGLAEELRTRVVFAGPQEDIATAMRLFAIHVTPSQVAEPFGRVALEAMLCGVVSIVSDRGGLPEIVSEVDRSLVFPAADPGALARLLAQLLDDDDRRARLARQGHEEVIARFAPQRQIARLLDIYEELVDKHDMGAPRADSAVADGPGTGSGPREQYRAIE